jgi:hypothetical protein
MVPMAHVAWLQLEEFKKKKAGKIGGNQEQQQESAAERRNDGAMAGGIAEDTAMVEVGITSQQNDGEIRESNTPYHK